ncbi:peptidase S1 and S6 chymotrypsin/Hap family protein [Nitzschia inconspicua]|uniref:Peptidase S1 and S6 chymotrypsin/Hap family protein n=1 Tax=Nitzschia inconspicua TaxID=303405 RepID=A0A9K3LFD0_9STRA|nr:peptidase S1 and S6 chymotrypsin/Hap family protein [Nitzschia inconspicua]
MLDRRMVASFAVLLGSILSSPHRLVLSEETKLLEHQKASLYDRQRKRRRTALEPHPRIVNGVETPRFRYPYAALLTAKHALKCGGSMIAPDILLTAAHCTESFSEVQVGRHNRSDDTEVYQSLIVETIVTHPSYYRNKFMDPDPHDFAVVKLYGHLNSKSQTSNVTDYIQINRNSTLPIPDQQMNVFGWGSIHPDDYRIQSDVLRETHAYYIPNDECRQLVGTYRNTTIYFEQVVIDVTLCAMDFENLSDSCRGDSGGGLVIRGETPQDDVLVGLVSAGYGCAHPTLPALYARVSEVSGWIREQVCAMSEHPPAYLDCGADGNHEETQNQSSLGLMFPCEDLLVGRESESTHSPSQFAGFPCDSDNKLATLILELKLDTRPEERGWLIRMKTPEGRWVTEIERPIFSYAESKPMSTVREALFLPKNREYELVLLDSYGDGHHSMGVAVAPNIVRLFDQDTYDDLLTVTEFSALNSDGYHLSSNFILGILPTDSPSKSPSPTISMTPSDSPSEVLPFVTVNITFGESPETIGFRLQTPKEEEGDGEKLELLHVVYPGNFSPDLRHSNINVVLPLTGSGGSKERTYIFTMTSNEGQGMETGEYQVWLGSIDDGELLFEGGIFYLEESTSFQVNPNNNEFLDDDVSQLPDTILESVCRKKDTSWTIFGVLAVVLLITA